MESRFEGAIVVNLTDPRYRLTDFFVIAFQPGSVGSVAAFVLICIAILACLLFAAGTTAVSRKHAFRVITILAIGIVFYGLTIVGIVRSGIFETAFIPFGPIFLIATILIAMSIGFTRLGVGIAAGVPLAWLVGFQAFRLPLEIVLHDWYRSGTIPESMTWSGSNWDIVSGIVALTLCPFAARWRTLAWVANVIGIVLLANVGRVAVMSSPVPFGWDVKPKLELIAYLPYAFIVPICVGGAALGHVLLTRRLLSRSNEFSGGESVGSHAGIRTS